MAKWDATKRRGAVYAFEGVPRDLTEKKTLSELRPPDTRRWRATAQWRNRPVIDEYGDYVDTCKKQTGSRKDARGTVLTALEQMCRDTGLTLSATIFLR